PSTPAAAPPARPTRQPRRAVSPAGTPAPVPGGRLDVHGGLDDDALSRAVLRMACRQCRGGSGRRVEDGAIVGFDDEGVLADAVHEEPEGCVEVDLVAGGEQVDVGERL